MRPSQNTWTLPTTKCQRGVLLLVVSAVCVGQDLRVFFAKLQLSWLGVSAQCKFSVTLKPNDLSFYESQNILDWSKYFCAILKTDLHIVPVSKFLCQTKISFSYSKFSFCARIILFGGAIKLNSIFGLVQIIWTGTKHFGLVLSKDWGPKKVTYFGILPLK